MSRYLDFIAEKIKSDPNESKNEAFIALGSAIFATMVAKHFMNKKEIEVQDQDPWAEGSDYAFIQIREGDYIENNAWDQKTHPSLFLRPMKRELQDQDSTIPRIDRIGMARNQYNSDEEAEEQFSFLDQATDQFDPFSEQEHSYSYDTSSSPRADMQDEEADMQDEDFFADFDYHDITPNPQYQDTIELPNKPQNII